jgi:pimeloyl-ACP methyl ester carboxylesterase
LTDVTTDHTLEDEAQDVLAVVRSIGTPVWLLGHSYGAHCALLAAAQQPDSVEKVVLYEPAWPSIMKPNDMAALEKLAAAGDWDQFAFAYFARTLHVPLEELEALRASALWAPIVADAQASRRDRSPECRVNVRAFSWVLGSEFATVQMGLRPSKAMKSRRRTIFDPGWLLPRESRDGGQPTSKTHLAGRRNGFDVPVIRNLYRSFGHATGVRRVALPTKLDS